MYRRRTITRAVIAGAAALCAFTTASASAETIGHVASNPAACGSNLELVDSSSAVGAAGQLTSFSYTGTSSNALGDFQVLRPTGNPNQYTVIDLVHVTDASSGLVTVPAAIPVQAGDVIGTYERTDNFPCGALDGGSPTLNGQFNTSPPAVGDTVTTPDSFSFGNSNLAANIVTDAVPPACGTLTVAPGAGSASISPSDAGSGIKSITNLKVSNGTSTVTPFNVGDHSATITITKTNPALKTVFNFDVTDVAGNTTHCS